MVKLTAIQMCSTPNVEENLAIIEQHLTQLIVGTTHIVVLPECCLFFGGRDSEQLNLAKETYNSQSLIKKLAALAKKYRVFLVAGSIPIYHLETNRFTNSCCVFSSSGELISQYNKLHLFDVLVDDSEKNYLESRYTQAGNEVVTAEVNDIKLGLSICYDLRFPELYRQLTGLGANIITVPSAFTKVTGKAHWQTLLRARAIENQVYIIAAGQEGIHANGRETWGHSMIINPWGDVIASIEHNPGSITVEVCMSELTRIRQAIPVADHNRFTTNLK